jgi:hypothetical protein
VNRASVKKPVLGQQSELFDLKIIGDLAKAFLMETALTVSQPVFLKGSSNSNHNIGGSFCHLCNFFIFTSFDDTIYCIRLIDKVLSLYGLLTYDFIYADFFSPGECNSKIAGLHHSDS